MPQRPSVADVAAGAPAPQPGSGQGSAAIDVVTQFAADNRLLVTAGMAGLVGAALIGPRAGTVAALADVTFTNVRLIPCAVKDGVARGALAVTGAVAHGGELAVESVGRAVNAVRGVHETGREALADAGRAIQDGFNSIVDARPRAEAHEDWWNRFGVVLAVVYLTCISLGLWIVGARRARGSETS
jgi:hypothetical protein